MAENKVKTVAPNINVTPLIDVLLVMLIIFMVIPPSNPYKLEAKIPEKPVDQENSIVTPSILVLTMDKNQQLTLNGQPINKEDLGARMKDILSPRPLDQRTLFIRAPKELSYSAVVNIIDIVKGAGASPIGLQVDYLDQM